MTAAFSPISQSILDTVARAFGWELCISTSESAPWPTQEQPKFFSWVHESSRGGLDRQFWCLGLHVIASR